MYHSIIVVYLKNRRKNFEAKVVVREYLQVERVTSCYPANTECRKKTVVIVDAPGTI